MVDEELQRLARIASIDPTIENLAKLGEAYLRCGSPQAILKLVGRRWFQKTYGNTYHRVDVTFNGQFLGTTPMQYGYGTQYEYTGLDFAIKTLNLPSRESGEPPWQWAKRNNIKYETTVYDVSRQRDL